MAFARIAGTGSYLPEKVLTNSDLAKLVETSDEWIASRTGIRERHVAAEGETTGDLAYHAAVRETIHSSLVSTNFARSALVSTFSGR